MEIACDKDRWKGNKRAAFQMSLFCIMAYPEHQLSKSITTRPFGLSNSCRKIMRSTMTSTLTAPNAMQPNRFCEQTLASSGRDTCSVNAWVGFSDARDCASYCDLHGMDCTAAAIDDGRCEWRRDWACNAVQNPYLWHSLLCTCAERPKVGSVSPSPSRSLASVVLFSFSFLFFSFPHISIHRSTQHRPTKP